jgi:2,3-bisphosphoglycerate-independent phosphoglycerate mutase
MDMVAPGITPGSGPGHFALFGYDPLEVNVGRGVPEALGSGFDLQPSDLAIRGNFCAVFKENALIADRRAHRPQDERCVYLCRLLQKITLAKASVKVQPVSEHRFLMVLRGQGFSAELTETDPQTLGVPIPPAKPLVPAAELTAEVVNEFVRRAGEALQNETVIGGDGKACPDERYAVLLRGYGKYPSLTTLPEIYGIRCGCVATHPMYKGVALLVGMELLGDAHQLSEQIAVLQQYWNDYDFFFVHVKYTDKAGEDGDFVRKAAVLSEVDALLPDLRALNPDVLVVTGDHSTPALMKSHSWHPVPVVLWSRYCGQDRVEEFTEAACARGALGRFRAVDLMPQIMANAGRLEKFGA